MVPPFASRTDQVQRLSTAPVTTQSKWRVAWAGSEKVVGPTSTDSAEVGDGVGDGDMPGEGLGVGAGDTTTPSPPPPPFPPAGDYDVSVEVEVNMTVAGKKADIAAKETEFTDQFKNLMGIDASTPVNFLAEEVVNRRIRRQRKEPIVVF